MPVAETDLLSVVVQKKSCVKAASTTAAMGKRKAAGLLRGYSTTFSCGGFSANPNGPIHHQRFAGIVRYAGDITADCCTSAALRLRPHHAAAFAIARLFRICKTAFGNLETLRSEPLRPSRGMSAPHSTNSRRWRLINQSRLDRVSKNGPA